MDSGPVATPAECEVSWGHPILTTMVDTLKLISGVRSPEGRKDTRHSGRRNDIKKSIDPHQKFI